MKILTMLYQLLVRFAPCLTPLVLLLVRLAFGWEMYLSGYRHLHNIDGMVSNFIEWGVPFPRLNVYISGITELVGGMLFMTGLASRLISVPLAFNFAVAIATAGKLKIEQAILGGQYLDPDRYHPGHLGGLEAIIDDTAFPFLVASLVILAMGPGLFSIDALLKRTIFRKHANALPGIS